jgi:nondiscriminating glutamyl-tRNA synthetase
MSFNVRVRFAPSPTGFMHLGNVRAALLNFLFARQHQGTFILRIEDTDAARNLDVAAQKILDDLSWLGLKYDEGPIVGGNYGPYNQSDRSAHYQRQLDELIANQKVYRCFCSPEELEKKRERQIALKKPPRYDRTCLHLSEEKVKAKIAFGLPFVWRFALNSDQAITIHDLAKGEINFEMHNFADFPLTRADGSFTFIFANFVDDCEMKMTHVVRGEDHLSNTALQAALYDAFAIPLPTFWHLPMICNVEGKKLSKRDFGFSLDDLIQAGFLPEAIVNYLALIGTSSTQELQSVDEIIKNFNFSHVSSAAAVRYDVEKLTWFNHQWIQKIAPKRLLQLTKPFLVTAFGEQKVEAVEELEKKMIILAPEMKRLSDVVALLHCSFVDPEFSETVFTEVVPADKEALVKAILAEQINLLDQPDLFLSKIQEKLAEHKGLAPFMWKTIRYVLTGSFSGFNFKDAATLLHVEQMKSRMNRFLSR